MIPEWIERFFGPMDCRWHGYEDWCDQRSHHRLPTFRRAVTLFLNPGECCGWMTERYKVSLVDLETMGAKIIDV